MRLPETVNDATQGGGQVQKRTKRREDADIVSGQRVMIDCGPDVLSEIKEYGGGKWPDWISPKAAWSTEYPGARPRNSSCRGRSRNGQWACRWDPDRYTTAGR